MSKKYLTGSKRLAIITRWINGVDDPEYDVYPTKKEGKYIVKPRNETTKKINKDINEEPIEPTETEHEEPEQEGLIEEPKTTPKPKQISRPISFGNSLDKVKPKAKQQMNLNTSNQSYDPTINIEILNQLKLLGEEFKIKREKKEQKRMIKEAVQKQIAKPRMHYDYTEPNYTQQPNQDEEMIEQPQPTLSRRRNNIFADIM